MFIVNKYLLIIIIISTSTIFSSESPLIPCASGQKNLYTQKDLLITTSNNISQTKSAYDNGDYRLASLLATGIQQYTTVMNIPLCDLVTEKTINFIIADSHINLNSPQLALTAFERIHDQKTPYGIISSKRIAHSLYNKAFTLPFEHPLSKKLNQHADYFSNLNKNLEIKTRIATYTARYATRDSDSLIDKLRMTRDLEKQSCIVSCVKKYAENDNLRALCIMSMKYNIGKFGSAVSQKKALYYAYRYVTLLAKNPNHIPFEQYSIRKTLHDNIDNSPFPIHLYYDYLQETRNNDLLEAISTLNNIKLFKNNQSPIRNIAIDLCIDTNANAKKEKLTFSQIQRLESESNFDAMINKFITCEADIIIPLLKSHLPNPKNPIKCINYLLGTLYYYKKEYNTAKEYFQLSKPQPSDILTHYRIFSCDHHTHPLPSIKKITDLINLVQTINCTSKKSVQNKKACTLANDHLATYSQTYIEQLLHENDNKLITTLITLLLTEKQTSSIAIKAIKEIKNRLNTHKNQDNCFSLKSFYSTKIITSLLSCNTTQYTASDYLNLAELLVLCRENNHHLPSDVSNKIDKTIIDCLSSMEQHSSFSKKLWEDISSIYISLAKLSNKPEYCDKALFYGNNEAYLEKALLLQKQPLTKKIEQEIITLLKKHANSSSCSSDQSSYILGKLYFNYITQKNLLLHIPCNDLQALHYLQEAANNGNHNATELLGVLYARGIKNNDSWLLKLDIKKALNLFNRQKFFSVNYTPEILYHRGIIYYKKGLFESALQDLLAIPLSTLSKPMQTKVLLYIALAQLKYANDTNIQNQAFINLDKALKNSKYIDFSLIDSTIESILKEKTISILTSNDTSLDSLRQCDITGKIFCQMPDNTYNKRLNRAYGVQCLQYAADNDYLRSMCELGCLPEEDICLTDSINYLLKMYMHTKDNNNQEINLATEVVLQEKIPNTIADQYLLFSQYCKENKPKAALNYLSLLFTIKNIIINDNTPKEVIEPIIINSSHNTELQKLVTEFTTAPQTSNFIQQSAAALLGCLYSQSKNKQFLLKGIKYLEIVKEKPFFTTIKLVVSDLYFQLSKVYKQENSQFLYIEYLKKSAAYGNYEGIKCIITEWLDENPYVTAIPVPTLKKWIAFTQKLNLPEQYYSVFNVFLQKQKILANQNHKLVQEKQLNHPNTTLLTHTPESYYSKNKNYKVALNSICEKNQLHVLEKLVQQEHPHACILFSTICITNGEFFKKHLTTSLKKGIVQRKDSVHSVFIDQHFLYQISFAIELVTEHEDSNITKEIIKILLDMLTAKNINIKHLKQFLLDTRNIDLNNY